MARETSALTNAEVDRDRLGSTTASVRVDLGHVNEPCALIYTHSSETLTPTSLRACSRRSLVPSTCVTYGTVRVQPLSPQRTGQPATRYCVPRYS